MDDKVSCITYLKMCKFKGNGLLSALFGKRNLIT